MERQECHAVSALKGRSGGHYSQGGGTPDAASALHGFLRLRARGLRFGQGLARDHFVAVGGQVDERSDDHGHLLHVRLLNALVDIHVGMVSARVVVQRILNKLKTGQADCIERKVIGAAGVADGERVHAKVMERLHPCGEDGGDHFIPLEIDAADFAGAVVNVVVGVELGVFGSRLHHFGIGEMLLNVSAGAEQALFFAGPEADANGAAHLEASGLENADGFEHHAGACAIVGGAGATMPGIDVRADDNDFVGFAFVRAGDFADDVEGIEVVVVELVFDIELQGDRDLLVESLKHSIDAAVVFAGNCDPRVSWRVFLLIAAASLLNEYGSVVPAGRLDPGANAFFDEKLLYFET